MPDPVFISLAPMQGITCWPFRKALHDLIGGVDKFYSPFLRFEGTNKLRKSKLLDLLPENNLGINFVPQLMANSADELKFMSELLSGYGYGEINLNLGCPFPMVANKKLGSGLLPHVYMLRKMLDGALPLHNCNLSIKMRLGHSNENDILNVLPVLDDYPISEIIIHPRYGKQMYSGELNLKIFGECLRLTKHKIAFNGEIRTYNDYVKLKNQFPGISHWMIGRGLVANPFLALQIKAGGKSLNFDTKEQFLRFIEHISRHYFDVLAGGAQFVHKMTAFWEYFSLAFDNDKKILKRIKKSKTFSVYEKTVNEIFEQESMLRT